MRTRRGWERDVGHEGMLWGTFLKTVLDGTHQSPSRERYQPLTDGMRLRHKVGDLRVVFPYRLTNAEESEQGIVVS